MKEKIIGGILAIAGIISGIYVLLPVYKATIDDITQSVISNAAHLKEQNDTYRENLSKEFEVLTDYHKNIVDRLRIDLNVNQIFLDAQNAIEFSIKIYENSIKIYTLYIKSLYGNNNFRHGVSNKESLWKYEKASALGDELVLTCKRLNDVEQKMKRHEKDLTSTKETERKETKEKEDIEESGLSQFPIPESALYALIKMKCGIYTYTKDESKRIETLLEIRKLLRLYNNYFINDKSSLYVFKPKKDGSWYKRILPIEEYPSTIEGDAKIIKFEKEMCNSYYNTILGFIYRQLKDYKKAEDNFRIAINQAFFDNHVDYKPYRYLTPLQQLLMLKESQLKNPQNAQKEKDINDFFNYLNDFGDALKDKTGKTQYQEMISYFKVAAMELASSPESKEISQSRKNELLKIIKQVSATSGDTIDMGYEGLYLAIKDIKKIIDDGYAVKTTENMDNLPQNWQDYLGKFSAIKNINDGVKAKKEAKYAEAQQFFEKVINDLSDENLKKRGGNYSFWLTERLRKDAQKFLEETKSSQPPPTNIESKTDGGN